MCVSIQHQVMSVILTDTNDPNIDIHINDTLVLEGLANMQPDDDIPGILETRLEEVGARVFVWQRL